MGRTDEILSISSPVPISLGPEPEQAGVRRGVGPDLAGQDARPTPLDQEHRDCLIQPEGRADDNEPGGNGYSKSQGVDAVLQAFREASRLLSRGASV